MHSPTFLVHKFKLNVINRHGVAVVAALFFERVDHAAVCEHLLELIQAFVIVKVDAAHNLQESVRLDRVAAVDVFDVYAVVVKILLAEYGSGLRLVPHYRRKV